MVDFAFDHIRYERDGPIARITLDRPERLNAIANHTSRELYQAWQHFRHDDSLHVAILTGAGDRTFCAGADLKAQRATGEGPHHDGISFGGTTKEPPIDKPTIAAVNGLALGGGLEIVLCCDIRIAVPHARFGVPEVAVGAIPGGGGTQRLPRAIPVAVAAEMLLTGDPIDAETALRIGLISRIVPPEDLLPTATAIATTIAKRAPLAVRASKEALLRGLEMPLIHALALEDHLEEMLLASADFQEGLNAFAEKREPRFQGH